jgi:mevalonate kinase
MSLELSAPPHVTGAGSSAAVVVSAVLVVKLSSDFTTKSALVVTSYIPMYVLLIVWKIAPTKPIT